ncbi:MAG: DUF1501 domain-containing protein [Planctomycetes bacterium]|nr:DUF1501 domain-containing protein [Planctomycetota bacterium]
MSNLFPACGSLSHFNRRTLLTAAGASGLCWLTPVAEILARDAEQTRSARAKSVILLWLQGGPSQLETFDPHPGKRIAGGAKAIKTSLPGVSLAAGMEQTAELMDSVALVRSVVSKEGDHERATYNVKTGFRPDPTLVHPSIGAVVCHELPVGGCEIPRHVSILPGAWPGRGGYLGDRYDAFQTFDPLGPIPDVTKRVSDERFDQRLKSLDVVERAFARRRLRDLEERKTLQSTTIGAAVKMMSSEQLKAFDVQEEPQSVRDQFGDTPFGRGCLAAARLVEVGVRCVEVELGGWDSHANNHEIQTSRVKELDPALASLIRMLKERDLFDETIVLCGGEFGRTPNINPAGGRDHWPHGFSVLLAGGGIRGGVVLGETDPEGGKLEHPEEFEMSPGKGIQVANIHATVLHALGIQYKKELMTHVNRPMAISKGDAIPELLL